MSTQCIEPHVTGPYTAETICDAFGHNRVRLSFESCDSQDVDRDRRHAMAAHGASRSSKDVYLMSVKDFMRFTAADEFPLVVEESRLSRLRPYQRDGVRFLQSTDHGCLWDEMGLGKTVQALCALPSSARVLIISPKSMAITWQREAKTWAEREPTIFKNVSDLSSHDLIVSASQLHRIVKAGINLERTFRGVTLIVDEAHMFKGLTSQRGKAMHKIARAAYRVWALTGTPMPNGFGDLWGMLVNLNMHLRAFGCRTYFYRQTGHTIAPDGKDKWPIVPPHIDAIKRSFDRVAIRRKRVDVLPDLPEKTYASVDINIPSPEEPDNWDWGAIDLDGETLFSQLEDWQKEALTSMRAMLTAAKVPTMLDFVQDFLESGEKLVVGSCHVAPLIALEKMNIPTIRGAILQDRRQEIVDGFQNGEHQIIGVQHIAGGMGITLHAAHHMLMVCRDWVPANNLQLEDRICRYGQKNAVVVHDILSSHPIDAMVRCTLARKTKTLDSVNL